MNKAIGFILAAMAAGFLSGIIMPLAFGVRGAIFGGALAIGMLACKARRETKGHLSVGITVIITMAVTLVASLLIEGWLIVMERLLVFDEFPNDGTPVHTFLTGLLVALGMFLCYRSYLLNQRRSLKALFFLGLPSLSVLPRAASIVGLEASYFVMSVAYCFVAGLLPFLLLWGLVAKVFGFFREATYEAYVSKEEEGA